MKSFTTLILSAGLVSAAAVDMTAEKRSSFSGFGGFSSSGFSSFNSLEAQLSSLQLSGFDSSLYSIGNLGNLNVGGLSLGSFDLSNSNELANVLLELGGGLCLGNVFSSNSLESLGLLQELELLQMMAQLYDLLQLGFLNLNDVQSLFLGGLGFSQVGGNSFNLGILRRSGPQLKKSIKKSKAKRAEWKRQSQCSSSQQIQFSGSNATAIQAPPASGAFSAVQGGATATSVATPASGAESSASAAAALASASAAAATEIPEAD